MRMRMNIPVPASRLDHLDPTTGRLRMDRGPKLLRMRPRPSGLIPLPPTPAPSFPCPPPPLPSSFPPPPPPPLHLPLTFSTLPPSPARCYGTRIVSFAFAVVHWQCSSESDADEEEEVTQPIVQLELSALNDWQSLRVGL